MTRIYAVLAFLGLLPEPPLVHVRIAPVSNSATGVRQIFQSGRYHDHFGFFRTRGAGAYFA